MTCRYRSSKGTPPAVRQNNQELLAECDAVILFYGKGDEAWKRAIGNELKKAERVSWRHAFAGQLHLSGGAYY